MALLGLPKTMHVAPALSLAHQALVNRAVKLCCLAQVQAEQVCISDCTRVRKQDDSGSI